MKRCVLISDFLCCLIFLATSWPACAQNIDSGSYQFLRLASDSTSLIGPEMKPWHLRAKYRQFDPNGTVKHEGSFEAWWAVPEKFKISFTSADFSRTEYRNGSASFFDGSNLDGPAGPFPALERFVANALLDPLPDNLEMSGKEVAPADVTTGASHYQCYAASRKIFLKAAPAVTAPFEQYCFLGAVPAVRMIEGPSETRAILDDIVELHHHYLARKILVQVKGSPVIRIDVELAEPELGAKVDTLDPPANAKAARSGDSVLAPSLIEGKLLGGKAPRYPRDARKAKIEGTVVVGATITTQGILENMHIVSGPDTLQQAALDAVKTWRYKPFELNGELVAVQTTVNVVFRLRSD